LLYFGCHDSSLPSPDVSIIGNRVGISQHSYRGHRWKDQGWRDNTWKEAEWIIIAKSNKPSEQGVRMDWLQ